MRLCQGSLDKPLAHPHIYSGSTPPKTDLSTFAVSSIFFLVIAASYWGKFKTTFQMLMIIYLVVDLQFAYANVVGMVLVYVALALTVISLVDYIAKNYKVFLEGSSK